MDTGSILGDINGQNKRPRSVRKPTSDDDRRRIIMAHENGTPSTVISNILNIKLPTVYRILKQYRDLRQVEAKKPGGNKLTPDAVESIRGWVDEDETITLEKLAENVFVAHDLRVSHEKIAREVNAYKDPKGKNRNRSSTAQLAKSATYHRADVCPIDSETIARKKIKCYATYDPDNQENFNATNLQPIVELHDHSQATPISPETKPQMKTEVSREFSVSTYSAEECPLSQTTQFLQDNFTQHLVEADKSLLHDGETLWAIFKEMSTKLRACRTKAEQITVLGEMIIRYC